MRSHKPTVASWFFGLKVFLVCAAYEVVLLITLPDIIDVFTDIGVVLLTGFMLVLDFGIALHYQAIVVLPLQIVITLFLVWVHAALNGNPRMQKIYVSIVYYSLVAWIGFSIVGVYAALNTLPTSP